MSEFELNPMFLRMNRSLGDIVIYERDGKLYTRVKGKRKAAPSPAQLEIQETFARLCSDWSETGEIMRSSWYSYGEKKNMNGYNIYMKENFSKEKSGEPIRLFRQIGDTEPPEFTASGSGTGEIDCEFTIPANASTRHLHFFVKGKKDNVSEGEIRRYSAGKGAASPFKLTGLDSGGEYFIYAVLTDAEYTASKEVSASNAIMAQAGS